MAKSTADFESEIAMLKDKLKFTEEILDRMPCLVYINEVGKVGDESSMKNIYLNKFAIEKTGYGKEEANSLGSEFFRKIMHPDDYGIIDESINYLMECGGEVIYGAPFKFKPKNGDYIWLLGRGRIIGKNKDGTSVKYLNAAIDINEKFSGHNQIIELLKENKRLSNEISIAKLTKREREVLKCLVNGQCAKKAAKNLHISESTIISHRKNLLKKLNVHCTASLVRFAVENGLN